MKPILAIWLGLMISDASAQNATSQSATASVTSPKSDSVRADSTVREHIHYLYDPIPMAPGENVLHLGVEFSLLPAPIVMQEIPAPTFDIRYKRGLSHDLSFFGSFSTNYFTNILFAGLQYNTGNEDLSLAIGNAIAGFVGYMDLGGEFDKNTAAAIADVPMIRVGHRFEHVAVSLMLAMDYVLYAATRIGSFEDRGLAQQINDIFLTVAFEQPFYGHQMVSTGLSVTYTRTPYQSWMLYNVFDQYLVIPEFFFSFQLM